MLRPRFGRHFNGLPYWVKMAVILHFEPRLPLFAEKAPGAEFSRRGTDQCVSFSEEPAHASVVYLDGEVRGALI